MEFKDFKKTHLESGKTYTPEQLGYVESIIPKMCATCEYFKNPNVCNFKMEHPVHPTKGCCDEWQPSDDSKNKKASIMIKEESDQEFHNIS